MIDQVRQAFFGDSADFERSLAGVLQINYSQVAFVFAPASRLASRGGTGKKAWPLTAAVERYAARLRGRARQGLDDQFSRFVRQWTLPGLAETRCRLDGRSLSIKNPIMRR